MRCPCCDFLQSKVLDSRETDNGASIRRRRQCLSCDYRFTTYERSDDKAFFVVKKGSRRERFDRKKLLQGILKACEKRPVRTEAIEEALARLEQDLRRSNRREVLSETIGLKVMDILKGMDYISYVRFASVYRDFDNIESLKDFIEAIPSSRKK